MMTIANHQNNNMIDLGDAKIETRGLSVIGLEDTQQGARYADFSGIQSDD